MVRVVVKWEEAAGDGVETGLDFLAFGNRRDQSVSVKI